MNWEEDIVEVEVEVGRVGLLVAPIVANEISSSGVFPRHRRARRSQVADVSSLLAPDLARLVVESVTTSESRVLCVNRRTKPEWCTVHDVQ